MEPAISFDRFNWNPARSHAHASAIGQRPERGHDIRGLAVQFRLALERGRYVLQCPGFFGQANQELPILGPLQVP